jgi:hypothetical protein
MNGNGSQRRTLMKVRRHELSSVLPARATQPPRLMVGPNIHVSKRVPSIFW